MSNYRDIKTKQLAIKLRQQGLTYSEILQQVKVAKSTLAVWLQDVNLGKRQKQAITAKRLAGARRGARARYDATRHKIKEIKSKASKEVGKLSRRELWLVGMALYWAEGSKQKEHLISQQVIFANSDLNMIKLFLRWLIDIVEVPKDQIRLSLYIHETCDNRKALDYWKQSLVKFDLYPKTTVWKKNKLSRRHNQGDGYYGLIRIAIAKSADLNRKISGWIEGIIEALC